MPPAGPTRPPDVSSGSQFVVDRLDVGVGPGAIVPLRSEIDISALPPGDYELRMVIYNFETQVPTVEVGVWEPEFVLARLLLSEGATSQR